MNHKKALNVLVPLVALLALFSACAGLFWPNQGAAYPFTTLRGQVVDINGRGLYAYDTLMTAAGFQGTDLVTLVVGLPLLAFGYFGYRRGGLKSALLLAGVLLFFLYNGISMSFASAYNPLFLVYVALMSASLYAFILTLASIDLEPLRHSMSKHFPRRVIAVYFFLAGSSVLGLWGMEVVESWKTGQLPAFLGSYTTMVTHGLDMGLIGPTAYLIAVLILKRQPNGIRLGFPLAILNILIGLCVISQTVVQLRAGVVFSPVQLIAMISSWLILAGFAAWTVFSMAKHIKQ